jgi:hypothetical protein
MQLSPHFADTELGVAGCEQRLIANATVLCEKLLEPVRAKFGSIAVDDGYRDPGHNARVGGACDSQHLYEAGNAAADIRVIVPVTGGLQTVFDWIRLDSKLPFDQVILEFSKGAPACVHLSYDSGKAAQRREALVGETNGQGSYTPAQVI